MKNVNQVGKVEEILIRIPLVIFMSVFFAIIGVFAYVHKLRLKRVTDYEMLQDGLVFKNKDQIIFTFKKHGKHNLSFSKGVMRFSYFGCRLENDCFEFRATSKLLEEIMQYLEPDAIEKGNYCLK